MLAGFLAFVVGGVLGMTLMALLAATSGAEPGSDGA